MLGARPGIPIFYQLAPWLTDDLFIIQPITLPFCSVACDAHREARFDEAGGKPLLQDHGWRIGQCARFNRAIEGSVLVHLA